MNLKVAKKLRKISKQLAYENAIEHNTENVYGRDYIENERNRKKVPAQARDENGIGKLLADGTPEIEYVDVSLGTITLADTCIRGIYQKIKRQFKAGQALAA